MAIVLVGGMLSACADTDRPPPVTKQETGATSIGGGRYKIGSPYEIKGRWYHPKVDYAYQEEGNASWYGADFHGKATANGEIYDMNAMTAAHRTLPMPSMVQVTNMENGRTVRLRVNDRGPFSKERIIDVSRQAAQVLGFKNQGVVRVKVAVLADESRQMAELPDPEAGASASPLPVIGATAAKVEQGFEPPRKRAPVNLAGDPTPTAASSPHNTIGGARPAQAFVQAGAFSKKSNAERARRRLGQLGQIEIDPLETSIGNLYRVRLGPLPSGAEAERMRDAAIRAGYPGSQVIVLEQ